MSKRKHPKPCLLCITKGFKSRLDQWKAVPDLWRTGQKIVFGTISDDARWPKEEWGKKVIWTTEIQWIDEYHLRTRNTNYILGEPFKEETKNE